MTHESSNLSSYNIYPSKHCVKTANGSSSAVSGVGSLPLISSMSLSLLFYMFPTYLENYCPLVKLLKS